MIRQPLVAGNWKMNGSRSTVIALADAIKSVIKKNDQVDVLVLPSFVHLSLVEQLLVGTKIQWGAQNLHQQAEGAFTGEVSGSMLADLGCQYVLVGHSERRQLFHEDLEVVLQKFKAALQYKITPILCVGETLAERENGQTQRVIEQQIQSVIEGAGINAFEKAVVAYEPVWAIGTGRSASPEVAEEAHSFIRQIFAKQNVDVANSLRILYGGSVKADNALGLFTKPDIDGALVGGASLDVASFLAIAKAASSSKS